MSLASAIRHTHLFSAALKQSLRGQHSRSMTVLSKQSGEEYKKLVGAFILLEGRVGRQIFCRAPFLSIVCLLEHHFYFKNYTSRMKETGRPVSPHVTIYAFPIAALSSITNRVTGIAMAMGCFSLGSIEIVGGSGSALALMQMIGSSGSLVAAGAKFAVAFPASYHYLGGLRHLSWDNKPDMLTTVDVERSSYYLFGAATVLATGAMFI